MDPRAALTGRNPRSITRPTDSAGLPPCLRTSSVNGLQPRPQRIAATGLRKSYGDHTVLDGIDLTVAEGTVSPCSAPTAPARPPSSTSSPRCSAPTAGRPRSPATTSPREPDGVRAAIGVTGQFSAVDELLTGAENLRLMADLHHLDRAEAAPRVAELLERFDLVDAADKPVADLLRRHAPPPRPGDDADRRAAADLPRRADDRPRPAQPPHDVGRSSASWSPTASTVFLTTQYLEEADQLADRIAVLDRGRLVAEGTPAELKRRVPGGHVRLQFTDADGLAAAARALRDGARATPRPSPCSVPERRQHRRAARACSTGLDGAGVDGRRPDGPHPRPRRRLPRPHRPRSQTTRRGGLPMSTLSLRRDRLGDDAAPQPAATPRATRR